MIISTIRERKVINEQQIKVQEGCPLKCRGIMYFVPGDMIYLPCIFICFSD